jgi:AraC family transcriptional regulator of adaptative response/methylated-DNA-[protein]-cysteine methyltransferase
MAGADPSTDRVLAAAHAMDAAGGPLPAAELAQLTHCSERQLSRSFRDVLGITPREYGEAVRTGRARELLRQVESVTAAVYEAGYGSSRAFYEEAGQRLGMAPREYARGGDGRALVWSVTPVRISDHDRWILGAASPEGLCAVRIGPDPAALEAEVAAEFPRATLHRDDDALADVMRGLTLLALGETPDRPIPLDVQGTAFQARVWDALVRIPAGQTRSYAEVAEEIGRPTAVRAVARACATNPVALVVPCHRVVRSDGSLSGYRWGLEVKAALIRAEGRDRPTPATMKG